MVNGTLPDNEPSGKAYQEKIKEEVEALIDRASMPLGTIAGTANALTCAQPAQWRGGWVEGVTVSFIAASTNTGGVTLKVGSLSAVDVVADDGSAFVGGELVSGKVYLGVYSGTSLRILGSSDLKFIASSETFDASGIWVKPTGLRENAQVNVKMWGGGGGGGRSNQPGGGGGGAYEELTFTASELPSSLNVNVAPSALATVDGENSSISNGSTTYLIAYGGRAANGTNDTEGGDGAGFSGPGSADAGAGGNGWSNASTNKDGEDALTVSGGGGGGGGGQGQSGTPYTDGGNAYFGGGGGGGVGDSSTNNSVGGVSKFGGNGGAAGANGQAPGGGGGGSPNSSGGAGGRGGAGRVIISVIG